MDEPEPEGDRCFSTEIGISGGPRSYLWSSLPIRSFLNSELVPNSNALRDFLEA